MIASGNKTLSDISKELDLAPSTISQHLQELKEIDAVEEVQNEHIKKWKYYKLNPNFDYSKFGINNEIANRIYDKVPNRVFFYAIGVVLVAVLTYFLVASGNSNVQKSSLVQVSLTDPPIVPIGTQALYINYSSVSINAVGNGASEWIQSNASGQVDLMSLINVSQVIAGIEVTHNFTISEVRFNISSARILINGTEYPVLVPNGQITTRVLGSQNVNASSEVLVDLSPTVVGMYINGSTEFVMLPEVKAVVAPNQMSNRKSGGKVELGQRAALNDNEMNNLYNVRSNISITSAVLTVGSNSFIGLSVTVKNEGNANVLLSNILIVGSQTPMTKMNYTCGTSDHGAPVPQYCIGNDKINATSQGDDGWQIQTTGNAPYPISAKVPIQQGERGGIGTEERFGIFQPFEDKGIAFLVNNNGTLMLVGQKYGIAPLGDMGSIMPTQLGYKLISGQSATFTFNGQLNFSGDFRIALIQGVNYTVAVLGLSGSHSLKSVTAG